MADFEKELHEGMEMPVEVFIRDTSGRELNVEEHWHDCIEFQFILEGKAEQTINAKRYITAEGELALILGGDIHATRCRPGQRTRIMVLKFMPSLFESGGYYFLNKREAVPALSNTTANILFDFTHFFDIIKGGGFMMTYTAYDPETLEQWCSDKTNFQLFDSALQDYLQIFSDQFHAKSQKKYFSTLIKGFFSPLDRKSLEPIALQFLGEDSVRSLQQFYSRSPLPDQQLMDTYQQRLSSMLDTPNGMLSVDECGFPKKGTHSVGVKRQYCGCLGKTENCQVGVFLAYAGDNGYGLVDRELYIPQEWFGPSYDGLRKECRLPPEKTFATKNQIALDMLNRALDSGLFHAQWIGCDAAYGNDHAFLDGLHLPEQVWYFAATNCKELVFLEQPQECIPPGSGGRRRKHPPLSPSPVRVESIAQDPEIPWEWVTLAEGSKGPIQAQKKQIRCVSCRADRNRNYVEPGPEIWLYLRKYEDGRIKYFVSNAPGEIEPEELDRAATLRWPIEQSFEECKSYLGMGHYECRSYTGWKRHMQFVMIAHLFTTQIKALVKKKGSF